MSESPGSVAGTPAVRWSLEFTDERDFCRFASILIGAPYVSGRDALKRFEGRSLYGEGTHGAVSAHVETLKGS